MAGVCANPCASSASCSSGQGNAATRSAIGAAAVRVAACGVMTDQRRAPPRCEGGWGPVRPGSRARPRYLRSEAPGPGGRSALDHGVAAGAAVQGVLAGATEQHVVAGGTEERVRPGAADQDVVAVAAVGGEAEHVGREARRLDDVVVGERLDL